MLNIYTLVRTVPYKYYLLILNDFINSIIDIYLTFLYDYRETADVTDHDRLLVSDGGSSTDAVTRLFKQYKR